MSGKKTIHDQAILRSNVVLGASDGIVTTFAIIAGSKGASLSSGVVVVLGLAKVFADAVSMSSGVYLGLKSEIDFQNDGDKRSRHRHSLLKHVLLTFFSFTLAGILPLMPYLLGLNSSFVLSSFIVAVELFSVGSFRTYQTKRKWYKGGLEMFLIGGGAAIVAYIVGFVIDNYLFLL